MRAVTKFPHHLQKQLCGIALLLASVVVLPACQVVSEPPSPPSPLRGQVTVLAQALVGIPYHYGGVDIDGFDCSGFVRYVYGAFGIELPHSARAQSRLKPRVDLAQAQPGDLLVFRLRRTWHSAIYLGERRFVHSPSRGGRVRIETLDAYWLPRLKAAIAPLK